MNLSAPISLVLADDHPVFRNGLRDILDRDPRFRIIGEAGDGEEALRLVRELRPRVIVLDIEMPKKTGLEVVHEMHEEGLDTTVLILTMYHQEAIFNKAMDLGVIGYVLKDSVAADIVRGIVAVASGEYFISPALQSIALRQTRNGVDAPAEVGRNHLTSMEFRVLKMIGESKTTPQIAAAMNVSRRTIDTHRRNLCRKLGLSGSYALLRYSMMKSASES